MDCCNKPTNTCFSAVRLVDLLLLYYSQGHGVENRETVQWDPGILTPSSMYLWLQGLTARIATEMPLSWLPIPELAKWQSQVTCASFVWDPGTMLLWYKPKWWLLFIEEKISGQKNLQFYGIALWLIHFQPP